VARRSPVGMVDRGIGARGVGARNIDPRTESEILAVTTNRVLSRLSDSELADALCVRDFAALEEAIHRHATRVASTVRRTVGGYYVDDVMQEVFLSLWRAPERFQPERGSLAAYLVTLTRGRAIDAVRSDRARQRRHREHGSKPTPADTIEDVVVAAVSAAELKTALCALPMTERVPIELAFFGGDSYRQVAIKLGQPEGTVKSRIRSGLRRLEVLLRRAGVE